ncbi:MAG: ATP-binding cassette domain-containing protein [Gammaproteobacteria bacterium]|nr:ATP-binding cassette domain-containing protein [Gammaproteobacteria bacterium]MDH5693127.1 ATP-binding cassette domain-containing protein [Gammaproteobacteria bacterium]
MGLSESNNKNLVEIRNLTFSRSGRLIVENIDLDIPRGKVTTIIGPSGTGKTTLLHLMTGQLLPDSGSVRVDGLEVPNLKREELFALRKRMGMMFQSGALFTDLTVFENVAFPLRMHTDLNERMIHDLVLLKLEAVGLRGAKDKFPSELSGGMKRRVALARTIALDPMMIMYDEPFTGQDPITVGVIMKLIRLVNDQLGLTSVLVSHDVKEVSEISDHIYLVADTKVIAHGSPAELHQSDSGWVKQFLNGMADGPVPYHYPAKDYLTDLIG